MQVVDIVMNNLPASSMNGDYRNVTRSFMAQHPMHMHGHRFWVSAKSQFELYAFACFVLVR